VEADRLQDVADLQEEKAPEVAADLQEEEAVAAEAEADPHLAEGKLFVGKTCPPLTNNKDPPEDLAAPPEKPAEAVAEAVLQKEPVALQSGKTKVSLFRVLLKD